MSIVSRRICDLLVLAQFSFWFVALCQATFSGRATTYGLSDSMQGSCSLRKTPKGLKPNLFAAMNLEQYDDSSACGRCLSIEGPKGTIQAFAADLCSECGHSNLDLNTELWNAVVGKSPGIEPIKWQFIPCPQADAEFCLKEGTSEFWIGIQGINTRDGIKDIKVNGKESKQIGITSFYEVASPGKVQDNTKVEIQATSTKGEVSRHRINLQKDFCPMPQNSNTNTNTNTNSGRNKRIDRWRTWRLQFIHVF
jgi:expansin (peptidoglycan-binding protein)